MFQIFWTEDIMAEMLYRRRRSNPFLSEEQIGGTRRAIARTFGADSVITGYKIDETVQYPDVFDALVSSRPYKPPWTVGEALDEIRAQSGRHFDPRLVELFLGLSIDLEADEEAPEPVAAAA